MMKSSFLRKIFSSSVFAAAALGLHVVNAQSLPQGIQDVVKMKQAGLSDDVILAQIKNSGATYNLTVDQILSLKNQNVSDAVIKALISGNGSTATATVAAPAPAAPPAAPAVVTPPLAPAPNAVVAPPVASAPAAPDAAAAPSFDTFQAELSPYGNWVQVPGYGLCWQPAQAVADPLWRPYLDGGYWSYTDDGWYWQSDYPWGSVAFHYGRWFRLGGIWTWAPGYDYAPAWVCWREADGYNGWAPLPPAAVYHAGIGLYYNGAVAVDVDFGLGAADFAFVPYDHFWEHNLRFYHVPHDRVVIFWGHSHIMNGYHMDHGHFRVEGLGHEHVFAVTHREVRIEHDSHWDAHGGRFDPHDNRFDAHGGHDGVRYDPHAGHDGGRGGGRDGGHDRHDRRG